MDHRKHAGCLCELVRAHPSRTFAGQDVDYEVELAGGTLGAIRRLAFLGGAATSAELTDRHCFEVVSGHPVACQECPAQAVASKPIGQEQTAIRHHRGYYEITSAVRADVHLVRIRIRQLRATHLRDAQTARIEQLSADATLSPREREVLRHLLLGATTEEIAAAMGITRRTVKFHQANLLTKLGADSRADLLRILA